MKKIIVDIDNTLWDFAPVLYERIKKINPDMIPPSSWLTWDFWKPYLGAREFYFIIREIHKDQCIFEPYPDAGFFLSSLRERGFYIIIASHREKDTLDAAVEWLTKYNLTFDDIHLSHDKTILFNDCWAVVDDSPLTLDKAAEMGILRAGLKNPWNKDKKHPLFANLIEIFYFLLSNVDSVFSDRRD